MASDVQTIWDLALASFNTDDVNLPIDETGILKLFESVTYEMSSNARLSDSYEVFTNENIMKQLENGLLSPLSKWEKYLFSLFIIKRLHQNTLTLILTEKDIQVRDFTVKNVTAKIAELRNSINDLEIRIMSTIQANLNSWEGK